MSALGTQLSLIPSVGLSVSPESVLWQDGWLDPDTVWGGKWGRSRHGCIRWDPHAQRKGEVLGGFVSIGLNGIFLTEMYFTHRLKRTWIEVVQKDYQARKLNCYDAVDHSRWSNW